MSKPLLGTIQLFSLFNPQKGNVVVRQGQVGTLQGENEQKLRVIKYLRSKKREFLNADQVAELEIMVVEWKHDAVSLVKHYRVDETQEEIIQIILDEDMVGCKVRFSLVPGIVKTPTGQQEVTLAKVINPKIDAVPEQSMLEFVEWVNHNSWYRPSTKGLWRRRNNDQDTSKTTRDLYTRFLSESEK